MPIDKITSGYPKSLESLKERQDPETIKAVAKEMETLFAYELIKAMRKITEQSLKSGLGGDVYMSLFDMEIARLCANQGLGIKEMLMRSLERGKYIQQTEQEIQKVSVKP